MRGGGVRVESCQRLKSVHIDVEKGECLINGEDMSQCGERMKLEFDNGEWSLVITTVHVFAAPATSGFKESISK